MSRKSWEAIEFAVKQFRARNTYPELKGGKTFIFVARRDKIASSSSSRTPTWAGKDGQREGRGRGREKCGAEFFSLTRRALGAVGGGVSHASARLSASLPVQYHYDNAEIRKIRVEFVFLLKIYTEIQLANSK